MSQGVLARAAGVSQQTIGKLETGEMKATTRLGDIARALGVSPGELDPQFADVPELKSGYNPPPRLMNDRLLMPVYSSAEGGDGSIIVDAHPLEYVMRPYTLESVADAYAILITGDSMTPAFEPGDRAWVNPRLPPIRNADCIFYQVNGNGDEPRAMIKRLVGWTDSKWSVKQWNPAKEFKLDRAEWSRVHRVEGKFSRR